MLWLMIKDELKHLWRNRFVRIVMICLPLMLPASLLAPAEDAAAMMAMAQMVFVQVSGLITGAVITASLVSDIQQGVPVLFAVRPQPRVYFLMARGAGMVVFLASGLLCGLGAMLLLNHFVVHLPIQSFTTARHAILTGIPGILVSSACGLMIGVFVDSIPSGMVGFVFLANNLVLGLTFGFQRLPAFTGWSLPTVELAHAGAGLVLTMGMGLAAAWRFSRRAL